MRYVVSGLVFAIGLREWTSEQHRHSPESRWRRHVAGDRQRRHLHGADGLARHHAQTEASSSRRGRNFAPRLVDVRAADAGAAVGWPAWDAYRPDATRPLKLATAAGAAQWLGGAARLYRYETSPNEKAVVYALAWRAGSDWTVVIVEASQRDLREAQRGRSR